MARKTREAGENETVATKTKKIAIGTTAAGVLLMVFLVIFLVLQFVQIGVKNADKRRLENEVKRYEQLNDDLEKDLDFFETEEGLRMLAVMNGYKKK